MYANQVLASQYVSECESKSRIHYEAYVEKDMRFSEIQFTCFLENTRAPYMYLEKRKSFSFPFKKNIIQV